MAITRSRVDGSVDPGGRFERALLLLLLASLPVQGVWLAKVRDMRCAGDACLFIHCARSLLAGGGWHYAGPRLSWDSGHTPAVYLRQAPTALVILLFPARGAV